MHLTIAPRPADPLPLTSRARARHPFLLAALFFLGLLGTLRAQGPGSLDTSFNPGAGTNAAVYGAALQTDGKVVLGGFFTTVSFMSRNRVARLNSDGTVDATFDPGTGANNLVHSPAVQADGKIVIGGDFTSIGGVARSYVARLNADGSLDSAFTASTNAGSLRAVRKVVIQPDGKILLGGDFSVANGVSRGGIARLNADGTLDTGFDPGSGISGIGVLSIAVQADSKVIIGGSFSSVNGVARKNIARLNADGSLDTGFNPGSGANGDVNAVATQADGKVLLGGAFTNVNGTARSYLARLNADGSVDTAYATGGGATGTNVLNVSVQTDGKGFFVGEFDTINGIARKNLVRLNTDGSVDTGFDPGTGSTGSGSYVFAGLELPTGQIIIAGSFGSYNGVARGSVARLNGGPGGTPAPVITSASTASAQVGQPFTFQIAANNAPTSFGATPLPAGLSVNPTSGLISGTPTAAGSTTATVSATNAGGTGTGNLTITVSSAPVQPPVITSATSAGGQVGQSFSYQIAATNAPTSFNATGLPAGLSVDTATGLISGTPTAAGSFGVALTATNAGGPGSATLTLTISSAPVQPPVVTSPAVASGQVGQGFTYQVAATNSPTSFGANGLPAGLGINAANGLISGTPTTAGTFAVTLSASNAGGIGSATLTLTVAPIPAPFIVSASAANAQVDQPFTYQIAATNGPTSFGASGLPAGLAVNGASGLISGTPTATGTFAVTVSATNAGGTGSAGLTLTVASTPVQPPVLTSATSASGQVGQSFTYQITATNGPTSYGASGLPAGLGINAGNGLITGTPTAAGVFAVSLAATNAGGTGSVTLTLTFAPAPPPAITSAATANATVGQPFTYQIAASNGPTAFNATGLPAGFGVNPGTGLITGTPTAAGTFLVSLSATNNDGTGVASLTLTVAPPPVQPPAVTNVSLAGGTVDGVFAYQITATNSPTGYAAGGLPAGLSVDAATGLITGTPTVAGTFSVTLVATNAVGTGSVTLPLTIVPAVVVPAGGVAPGFDPGVGSDATVRAIAFLPDGRALIGGAFTSYQGVPRSGVARVYLDGSLDLSFDPGTGADDTVNALLLQANGQVIVAGDFSAFNGVARNGVVRLNSDGSVDLAFDAGLAPGGRPAAARARAHSTPTAFVPRRMAHGKGTNVPGFVAALGLDAKGKLTVGGAFTGQRGASESPFLTRVAADTGAPDPGFAPGAGAPDGPVRALAVQADGKVVIGGLFANTGATPRTNLARLGDDGRPDLGFDPGAGAEGGAVEALLLQEDGSIVLGGDFVRAGGQPRARLAKVTAKGALDSGFGAESSGADRTVRALSPAPGGGVLVGGDFSMVDGQPAAFLARVQGDGRGDAAFNAAGGTDAPVAAIAVYTTAGVGGGASTSVALVGGDFAKVANSSRSKLALVDNSAPASPPFFSGGVDVGGGFSYLPSFGYYKLLPESPGYVYHNDLGFLFYIDARDGKGGAYFYDFATTPGGQSLGFFYTAPGFPFPYLYSFELNAFLYYFPDVQRGTGFYTSSPRVFVRLDTGEFLFR